MVGDFTFTNPPKPVSLITAYPKLRAQIQVSNKGDDHVCLWEF